MKFIVSVLGMWVLLNAAHSENILFGGGADMSKITAINEILKSPDRYLDSVVTIEGTISSVCKKKGCWMVLSSGSHQLRIKVNDGEMVFPFNTKGKTAFATGKLEVLEMTREKAIRYLAHLAEDAEQAFDESTVTEETVVYQLRPTQVTIMENKD